MEISTDMKKINESKCFGIAWDGEVKECKICEVASVCKQRTLGGVKQATATAKSTSKNAEKEDGTVSTMKPSTPRPEPKNTDSADKEEKKPAKKSSKTTSKAKADASYDSDMPDFKPMSVDELLDLAKERGLNISEFDKYTNTSIKKMRVTMALKKTYEVK